MRKITYYLPYFLILFIFNQCKTVAPPKAILPVPSKAQLAWHDMEMNAFIHFTTNTFTDLEWGYGDESPAIFNPSVFDANQWVTVMKATGFKGVVLTCKHHDGFCLWPSKFTSHSIENSPKKIDVVRALSDACKKQGLKFGVYLSPWDRNHADYGTDKYVTYYRNQLKELFDNYGPIFEMWMDGANGGDGYYGGKREKRQINGRTYYRWPETIDIVKKMNPNVIFFSDAGPSIRWVGNERGVAGETNWNTITPDTLYAGKAGIEGLLNTGSEDGTHWIPAEVDVSIRPGWFYHAKEDEKVKSGERLFEIYLTSVGRGSNLLLNIPPDRRGLFHENDVKALQDFRKILDTEFKNNLIYKAKLKATNTRSNKFKIENTIDKNKNTYWATKDGVKNGDIEIQFLNVETIKYIQLAEEITLGQRIKQYTIEYWQNNNWVECAKGSTIGYKRILKFDNIKSNKIRIRILDAKEAITLKEIAIF